MGGIRAKRLLKHLSIINFRSNKFSVSFDVKAFEDMSVFQKNI